MKQQNKFLRNGLILEILKKYSLLWSIRHLLALSHWDLNTYMPKEGIISRAKALSNISTHAQKLFLDKEFVGLIKKTDKQKNLNKYEKAILRILKRDLKYYQRLPPQFIAEFVEVTSKAHLAWVQAKEKNNFLLFEPHLKKIVELSRKKASYLGYKDHPYDALLDEYEENLTTKDVQSYFNSIKKEIISLINYIKSSKFYKQKHKLEAQTYNLEEMKRVNQKLLEKIHYNLDHLRLDVSPHPFSINIGPGDQRITTRYETKNFARTYMSVMHEYGHALYEIQSNKDLYYTPIHGGSSLILHESQSRFWENMVGRTKEFVDIFYDDLKTISKEIKNSSSADIYHYFNLVRPSPIRTEADEVTYHLHIIICFEIEKGLIEGKIKVEDLPEIWNKKYEEYLGVKPKSDSQGILQDIHWSQGSIGYFPTYSFGTALSAIWKNQIEKDLGKISDLLKTKKGIRNIQDWLKENIHQYGSTYTYKHLVKKVTKQNFSPKPLLEYLNAKYKSIY